MDEYPIPSEGAFDSLVLGIFLLSIIAWAVVGIVIGKVSASMNLRTGVVLGWALPPSVAAVLGVLWLVRLSVDYLFLVTLLMAAVISYLGFQIAKRLEESD